MIQVRLWLDEMGPWFDQDGAMIRSELGHALIRMRWWLGVGWVVA